MADYTYQELMRMQNDAIKRVEDMQKRARTTAGLDEARTKSHPKERADRPRHIPMPEGFLNNTEKKPEKSADPPAFKLGLGNGDVEIDSDKALLLSLILLLSEEGADELLLAALVYMLGGT